MRTGVTGLVRLEFPLMSLTAGPSSTVSIPAERILSTVLDEGRVETASEGEDIVKMRTHEAEVRGQGRGIVRRHARTTWVMAQEGTFRVASKGRTVVVKAGQGARVRAGQAPEAAVPLPDAPRDMWPAGDPVYVTSGQPVALRWRRKRSSIASRCSGSTPTRCCWRASCPGRSSRSSSPGWARSAGACTRWTARAWRAGPSAEGLVCVVDR